MTKLLSENKVLNIILGVVALIVIYMFGSVIITAFNVIVTLVTNPITAIVMILAGYLAFKYFKSK
jgi:hypothetical protein